MILLLIAILLLISFLWALWGLRELKTPSHVHKKASEDLQKGRVIFYSSTPVVPKNPYETSSSSETGADPVLPPSSSSKSSSLETSGRP